MPNDDLTTRAEAMAARLSTVAAAVSLPWSYRPYEHDDWGHIRQPFQPGDYFGKVTAISRDPTYSDHDAHRRAGTDPYKAMGTAIVEAVNSAPDAAALITDLLAANAALVERVKGLEGAGWQPIDNAPYSTTVEVRAGSMTFLATLEPGISENDAGESVDQWCAAIDGEHPPCWSDGGYWSSNQDESPSIQPTAWRAALNPGPAS